MSGPSLRPGVVLDGRYKITAFLGAGGMGSVYKARHLELERDAAIKVMHPRYSPDVAAVKRFRREAQIISALRHPNILAVYSFGATDGTTSGDGEVATTGDDRGTATSADGGTAAILYLSMEYVQGTSLGRLIASQGPLAPARAVPLLLQICSGMSHAHGQGVLHRDLKPDNVMVILGDASVHEEVAKVVDFGLAKLQTSEPGQRLTRTGEVVGDPRYMSPEQCTGGKLDERSDVYSFGCLMYEVLSGQLPLDGDDPVAIMTKHLYEDPPPFDKRLSVPQALQSIALIAMSKEPKDRYESFEAVAGDLRRYCQKPDLEIALPERKRSAGHRPGNLTDQKRKRRALPVAVIACSFVGIVAIAAVTFLVANSISDWATFEARLRYLGTNGEVKRQAALSLATLYESNKNSRLAQGFYQEVLAGAKGDETAEIARCYAGLAKIALSERRQDEAADYFRRALDQYVILADSGKLDGETLQICAEVLKSYAILQPLNAVQSARNLGMTLTQHADGIKARQVLLAVAGVGPKPLQAEVYASLGELSTAARNWTDAKRYFDSAIKAVADDDRELRLKYLESASGAATAAGDNLAAASYLEAQLAIPRQEVGARYKLERQIGDSYFRAARYAQASKHYQQALSLAPAAKGSKTGDTAAVAQDLWSLAFSRFKEGKYQEAAVLFAQLSSLGSNGLRTLQLSPPAIYCTLGNCLTALDKFDAADREYLRALHECSASDVQARTAILSGRQSNSEIRLNKAVQAAAGRHDYVSVERACRTCLALMTPAKENGFERAKVQYTLADALRRSNRRTEAIQQMQGALQCLKLGSHHPQSAALQAAIEADMRTLNMP